MKFLCIECDEPMKLVKTAPPERGSLSVVYSCPSCARQIAMLTNPFETQLVQSLGVKIGPEAGSAKGGAAEVAAGREGVAWTPEARERLRNIPEFARPMAETGIEKFARDRGHAQIDAAVMDEAKEFFGM
jgi:hypothetical protein